MMGRSYAAFFSGRAFLLRRHRYDPDYKEALLSGSITVDRPALSREYDRLKTSIDSQLDDLMKRYRIFVEACEIDNVSVLLCPQPLLTLKPNLGNTERACLSLLLRRLDSDRSRVAYYDVYEKFLVELEALANEMNCPYLSLQDVVNVGGEEVFIDYCHLSPVGNDLIASAIAGKIKDLSIVNRR